MSRCVRYQYRATPYISARHRIGNFYVSDIVPGIKSENRVSRYNNNNNKNNNNNSRMHFVLLLHSPLVPPVTRCQRQQHQR